jgi:hypothetical protein
MALEDYIETHIGRVARVWPGSADRPKQAAQIILRGGPQVGTVQFYSWSPWQAAFCDAASKTTRAVTVDYSRTAWGKLIIAVDWAPEDAV